MTDKEVLQRFKKDFDKIKTPDLWDRIQENRKTQVASEDTTRKIKITPLRYIAAACLVVLVIGISVLTVVLNSRNNGFIIDTSETSSQTSADISKTESSDTEQTLIEQLAIKQVYGHFALSDRGEDELQTLFVTYNKGCQVYEDDDYLYNFDKKGNLIEIILINHDAHGSDIADKQDIQNAVNEIFKTYFPDVNINDYQVEITEYPDASPHWVVDTCLYESDVVVSYIHITFDKYGKMQFLTLPSVTKDTGNISKEQAIQIALEEAHSDKYAFLDFNREDVNISVEYQDREGKQYYMVHMQYIPFDEEITTSLGIQIDIYTGTILDIIKF